MEVITNPLHANQRAGEDAQAANRTRRIEVADEVLERNRILRPDQFDDYAQSFSLIRTQLLQKLDANGFKSFAVVSPGAGEGKTLTAVNLGVSIARSAQHTALVVDMDLRRPSIHERFEVEPAHSIVDVLEGTAEIPTVMIDPGIDDLKLLPGRNPAKRPAELLASRRTAGLTEELRNRYPDRILIFDLPPLLSYDDALAFLPNVDAYVLVVDEGRTRREDIERSLKLLDGKIMLGSVLNRSSEKLGG